MEPPVRKEPVYILIPVHNRRAITLSCLERLRENGDLACYQVVLIDDGSSDGTADAIRSRFEDVTILHGDGNLWWTGAIALGMRHASERQAEFMVWLNDDCHPEPGSIPAMIAFLRRTPGAFVGASCYLTGSDKALPTGFIWRRNVTAAPNHVERVQGLAGFCVAFPAAVCSAIGFPDPRLFPQYAADGSHCLRASRSGFAGWLLGDAKVNLTSQPNRDLFSEFVRTDRFFHAFRRLFLHPKSPFLLRSQFHSHTHKYGAFAGTILFSIKACYWTLKFLAIRIKQSFSPHSGAAR